MRPTARCAAWGLVGFAVLLAGCGSSKTATPAAGTTTTVAGGVNPNAKEVPSPGDIPDNQVFVAYSPTSGGYSLRYPQGWAQRQGAGKVTFSQNFNTIEVATARTPTMPSTASVRAGEVAKLRSLDGFKLVKVDSVVRSSGSAVRIVYQATSPTDPVTGKTVTLDVERYVFWHKGTIASVTLSSPKGSDNVDAWKTVTDSLAWK